MQATSRKEEGVEGYKIDFARDPDAFPEPKWPTQSLDELIESDLRRPHDRRAKIIPALLRLIGAKQYTVVSENFATIVVCDFEYEIDGRRTRRIVLVHGRVRAG